MWVDTNQKVKKTGYSRIDLFVSRYTSEIAKLRNCEIANEVRLLHGPWLKGKQGAAAKRAAASFSLVFK